MIKKFVVIGFACLLSAPLCAQQKEFSWLVGKWKLKDKNAFEEWTASGDGKSLTGKSYRVKGTDTVVTEEITLAHRGDGFYYSPDIAGNQGVVHFKITQFSGAGFVAENAKHDFPKLIRYAFLKKETGDVIEVSIEGDGKVIPFVFERVK